MADSIEGAWGDPTSWFNNARQLHAAAIHLADQLQVWRKERSDDFRTGSFKGTLLLLGFAVENALKGLIVAENKPVLNKHHIDIKQLFGPTSEQHNLIALRQRSGYEIEGADTELLERLTTIIQWAGRYPAPKAEDAFNQAKKRNPRTLNTPVDLDIVKILIEECERIGLSIWDADR